MAVKEFNTSARAAASSEEAVIAAPVTIIHDGRQVTFMGATEGQIALILAALSDTSGTLNGIATVINFFFSLLDAEQLEGTGDDDEEELQAVRHQLDNDVRYFKLRLLDPHDAFDGGDIIDIVLYLIEQWTARPTRSPSDFMQSQKTGGQKSTARRRVPSSTP